MTNDEPTKNETQPHGATDTSDDTDAETETTRVDGDADESRDDSESGQVGTSDDEGGAFDENSKQEQLESIELPDIEIAADGEGSVSADGVVTRRNDDLEAAAEAFVDAIAEHRHWERSPKAVPA